MAAWLPRVVSMGSTRTEPGAIMVSEDSKDGWHTHRFDELTLVTEGTTTIGHGGQPWRVAEETLFLFRRAEPHGFRNGPSDRMRLWVLHFEPDEDLYLACARLASPSAADRVWKPTSAEVAEYKGLFLKVLTERRKRAEGAEAAEAAWLGLLLLARFSKKRTERLDAEIADPELVRLWQIVSDHAASPSGLAAALRQVKNYDSIRHRFRSVFGAAPRELAIATRMEQAKSRLLETRLSVKEVADLSGYGRANEFSRAFARCVGCTPRRWRDRAALGWT
jgi:AraC-like DNA-binding protein